MKTLLKIFQRMSNKVFFIICILLIFNTIIVKPKSSGILLDFSSNNNQKSINLSFKVDSIFNNYGFQINLLNYEWLIIDPYNHSFNHSFLTEYNYITLILGIIPGTALMREGGNDWFWYVWIAPFFIVNSQHNYLLHKGNTVLSINYSLSTYYKSKLDYFEKNEVDFIRYKPEIGLEIEQYFDWFKPVSFIFDIGICYPIDYVESSFKANKLIPSFSIKLSFNLKR